jgi:hypothetical protein
MRTTVAMAFSILVAGCSADMNRIGGTGGGGSSHDGGLQTSDDGGTGNTGGGGGGGGTSDGGSQAGCESEPMGCYTVYAHGDHELYRIDLSQKQLVDIGPFKAPPVGSKMQEDVITDLAVSPQDIIYVISHTNLYTANSTDGHVTLVGPVTSCGNEAVALSFTVTGELYAADFKGAFCKIDLSTTPPTVTQIGTLGSGLALAGDLVSVADGTMFGTAYKLADASNMGTQIDNILVKINPATGQVTQQMGQTGFPKLFGTAYALGQVFGFTHDGSGNVVTIDPTTGKGTLFNTFMDPTTMKGISFAGAGVSPDVPVTIN